MCRGSWNQYSDRFRLQNPAEDGCQTRENLDVWSQASKPRPKHENLKRGICLIFTEKYSLPQSQDDAEISVSKSFRLLAAVYSHPEKEGEDGSSSERDTNFITWSALSFPSKKAIIFKIAVRVDSNVRVNTKLVFSGVVFQQLPANGLPYCASSYKNETIIVGGGSFFPTLGGASLLPRQKHLL